MVFATAGLAIGLIMLVWGGRAFASSEPLKPGLGDEEFRFCPPTTGEIAEAFAVGLAVRKSACLVTVGLGMVLACVSVLSLLQGREGEQI